MKKLILITLTLSLCGCGTGAMRFYNPVTKANVECEGGVGWQAQENKDLCVKAAMASGYLLQGH